MTTRRLALVMLGALVLIGVLVLATTRQSFVAAADDVAEKTILDNQQVLVMEYVFPAGFKGHEHEAPVNEFAYILDGEFSVVTKGVGKTVVKKGQIEFAPKGTIHYSLNESRRPARVLVVFLKER
ncbi:MAG TPA: cupin domain-containing protein [Methylomirabilota bacterium]|jgi:quercetin dioxygenase-like cupin family protein|nr:cupin domain-containing protein [Methylomirabilota bacterium]